MYVLICNILFPFYLGASLYAEEVANSCKSADRPSMKPEPSRPVSSDFFSDSARSQDEEPVGDNGYLPQSDCADVHAGLDRQAARICGKQVDQEDNLEGHHERPNVELISCAKAQSQEDLNEGHKVENNADPVLSEGENYSPHEIRT